MELSSLLLPFLFQELAAPAVDSANKGYIGKIFGIIQFFFLRLKGCNHGIDGVCCEGLLKERKWLELYYHP